MKAQQVSEWLIILIKLLGISLTVISALGLLLIPLTFYLINRLTKNIDALKNPRNWRKSIQALSIMRPFLWRFFGWTLLFGMVTFIWTLFGRRFMVHFFPAYFTVLVFGVYNIAKSWQMVEQRYNELKDE